MEESAGRAASFGVLLSRAQGVYDRILTPYYGATAEGTATAENTETAEGTETEETETAEATAEEKAEPPPYTLSSPYKRGNRGKEQWLSSVDALLETVPGTEEPEETPPSAAPEKKRTPLSGNPFPRVFPGAVWEKEEGGYLVGRWRSYSLTAVPGPYSSRPPRFLTGFTRYVRNRDGGYWIRIEEIKE